jgi:hypothetical protein
MEQPIQTNQSRIIVRFHLAVPAVPTKYQQNENICIGFQTCTVQILKNICILLHSFLAGFWKGEKMLHHTCHTPIIGFKITFNYFDEEVGLSEDEGCCIVFLPRIDHIGEKRHLGWGEKIVHREIGWGRAAATVKLASVA